MRLVLLRSLAVGVLSLVSVTPNASASTERIYLLGVGDAPEFGLLLRIAQERGESSAIRLDDLRTLDQVDRSERELRERFLGRNPEALVEFLRNQGFRCGSLGTIGRADIDVSCRRSLPGSWIPFAFARTTAVMFRGRHDAIEAISLVARLDNFP